MIETLATLTGSLLGMAVTTLVTAALLRWRASKRDIVFSYASAVRFQWGVTWRVTLAFFALLLVVVVVFLFFLPNANMQLVSGIGGLLELPMVAVWWAWHRHRLVRVTRHASEPIGEQVAGRLTWEVLLWNFVLYCALLILLLAGLYVGSKV